MTFENERAITVACQVLSPRRERIFRLHVLDGLSFKEISEQFGISANQVRCEYKQAVSRLQWYAQNRSLRKWRSNFLASFLRWRKTPVLQPAIAPEPGDMGLEWLDDLLPHSAVYGAIMPRFMRVM